MIGILVALSLLIVVVGIRIYARVFRMRAEHLLAEVKTFRVEQTSAATVLKLRNEYSSPERGEGACSEQHCMFSIGLTQWDRVRGPTNIPIWWYGNPGPVLEGAPVRLLPISPGKLAKRT